MIRCEVEINGGLSTLVSTGCAVFRFPIDAQELIDIHFVDDTMLILILRDPNTMESELMTIDYTPATSTYTAYPPSSSESMVMFANTIEPQPLNVISRRAFDSSWVPAQVTVNGKEGRRIGCVVADDAVRYLVCDLDHGEDEGIEGDETMEVDEDDDEEEEPEDTFL